MARRPAQSDRAHRSPALPTGPRHRFPAADRKAAPAPRRCRLSRSMVPETPPAPRASAPSPAPEAAHGPEETSPAPLLLRAAAGGPGTALPPEVSRPPRRRPSELPALPPIRGAAAPGAVRPRPPFDRAADRPPPSASHRRRFSRSMVTETPPAPRASAPSPAPDAARGPGETSPAPRLLRAAAGGPGAALPPEVSRPPRRLSPVLPALLPIAAPRHPERSDRAHRSTGPPTGPRHRLPTAAGSPVRW